MLNRVTSRLVSGITHSPRFHFGLGSLLLHYIRTLMNRVRWEENRELRSLETRGSTLPRSAEQANKLFVATEQNLSLSEEARMQRIDQILGTRTHFQAVKPYQERLDSDHVMDLEELKRKHPQEDRATLAWLNPKSDIKIKYKNKRKYYSFLSKLRTYPRHEAHNYAFADETNQNTIEFLGKQTVYSTISLKPVELAAQSLQGEPAGAAEKGWFQSQKYVYFRLEGSMSLLRTSKAMFKQQVGVGAFHEAIKEGNAQDVVSLDQIYEILKQYDTDQRVCQYLKKVQNGRVEYLFSYLSFDRSENTIAVMLDLLGTKKQYCLLIKSLTLPDSKPLPIFNVRPQAVFSADGQQVCYVQRSPQGGWVELVYRRVQSCWTGHAELAVSGEEGNGEVIFRCDAEKQLRVGTDSNKSYIFVAVRNYNQEFSQSLHLVDNRNDELQLITLDQGQRCKYYFDACPLGILFARFQQTDSFLKFGKNGQFTTSVQLVPYKQHLQLQNQEKIGINDGLLPVVDSKSDVPPPSQIDASNKRTIFRAGENQFIRQIQTRSTHLVAVLNLYSVYDKAVLSFLPFKASAHPHSLMLGGGAHLQLRSHNYCFASQEVEFSRPYGSLFTQKVYSIWKKELKDAGEERSRFHHQIINISAEGEYPLEIGVLCRSLYAQEKELPVVIYFPSREEEIEGGPLRQFLEKGMMVVEFRGRGTFTRDLQHFLRGSRSNFPKMLDDLQAVIEFIGNNFTKNISLYCKGGSSSLVGLWFNVYFPFLFNATILHNGVYDLSDSIQMSKLKDFFGETQQADQRQYRNRPEGDNKLNWDNFNIFKHQFRQPFINNITTTMRQIGSLQNIIISSDKHNRVHSRRLIHRLRENQGFRYEEVYLKQYENQHQTDLFNLSYFYSKIRTRMEQEQNDPNFDQIQEQAAVERTKQEEGATKEVEKK